MNQDSIIPFMQASSFITDTTFHSPTLSPSSVPGQLDTREQVIYITVGVVGLVVLISGALILISVTACLRQWSKRAKLLITTSNVAYHVNSGQLSETKETSAFEYDYVCTHTQQPDNSSGVGEASLGEDTMTENVSYGGRQDRVELSDNVAYGERLDTSDNVAYGPNEMNLNDNEAYNATATGDVREQYEYISY